MTDAQDPSADRPTPPEDESTARQSENTPDAGQSPDGGDPRESPPAPTDDDAGPDGPDDDAGPDGPDDDAGPDGPDDDAASGDSDDTTPAGADEVSTASDERSAEPTAPISDVEATDAPEPTVTDTASFAAAPAATPQGGYQGPSTARATPPSPQTDPAPPPFVEASAPFGSAPTPPPADGAPAPVPSAPGSRRGRVVAAVAGIVLLAGAAGAGGAALYNEFSDDSAGTTTSDETSLDNASSSDLPAGTVTQVSQKVMPSVVQINFTGSGGEGGSGSGVVISEDGKILTNNHVVEAAAGGGTLTVAFSDGDKVDATIIGTDEATDVAVIQAEGASGLEPASFGKSSDVQVGQEVVAIGSPFGLESTVTQGIVSALNRPVSPGDESTESTTPTTFPAIQTDAAINPGNSGGPLVDLKGRVIGINSAIRSSGVEGGSIGLGFAIPSDLARNVSQQILDGKKVEHARIGITVENATDDDRITGIGARVAGVEENGPGDEAGITEGDIVTAVNGHPVASNQALIATVRGYQPGDEVTLSVVRGDETKEFKVTLGSDADGRD